MKAIGKRKTFNRIIAILSIVALLVGIIRIEAETTPTATAANAKLTVKSVSWAQAKAPAPDNYTSEVGNYHMNNGARAYCIEHDKTGPQAGEAYTLTANPSKDLHDKLFKALYYGYEGPGQWSGFSSMTINGTYNEPLVATGLTLSHLYSGTKINTNNRGFLDFVKNAPMPDVVNDTALTLYDETDKKDISANGSITVYESGNENRTHTLSLKGDSKNYVSIPLPTDTNISLMLTRNGKTTAYKKTATSSSVKVNVGETFYFKCSNEVSARYSSGTVSGRNGYDIAIYKSGVSSHQNLIVMDTKAAGSVNFNGIKLEQK